MWWAGMRGVASVALALAIPYSLDNGSPFPQRDEMLFIAFAVIMATLVLQGLTLPWLVRLLGVRADTDLDRRIRARPGAARDEGGQPQAAGDPGGRGPARGRGGPVGARRLRHRRPHRPDIVDEERREPLDQRIPRAKHVQRLQQELLSAARHEVLSARSEPGAHPEVVDRMLRHLDVRSLR